MRLLVRPALCGLPAALVLAAGASPGTAREAIARPDQSVPVLVSPAPGQVFNAGAKFTFRVRTTLPTSGSSCTCPARPSWRRPAA